MTDQERTDWAIAEAFEAVRREWQVDDHSEHAKRCDARVFWRAVDERAAEYAKDAPRADGLDVDRLAAAVMSVDLTRPGHGWASAIAAEYAKLGTKP